jgi:hypothetical protein
VYIVEKTIPHGGRGEFPDIIFTEGEYKKRKDMKEILSVVIKRRK